MMRPNATIFWAIGTMLLKRSWWQKRGLRDWSERAVSDRKRPTTRPALITGQMEEYSSHARQTDHHLLFSSLIHHRHPNLHPCCFILIIYILSLLLSNLVFLIATTHIMCFSPLSTPQSSLLCVYHHRSHFVVLTIMSSWSSSFTPRPHHRILPTTVHTSLFLPSHASHYLMFPTMHQPHPFIRTVVYNPFSPLIFTITSTSLIFSKHVSLKLLLTSISKLLFF